jgi:glycosyltransferase involved in cell wall biosynthesis
MTERIAIVHEWLTHRAGSERAVENMLQLMPQADLHAMVDFLPPDQRVHLMNKPVTTSFIQRLPFARKKYRGYLPLMPLAVEQFDLSKYDIVISSSHAVAKGVLTRSDQLHVCYCYTPVRYAWDLHNEYLSGSLRRGIRSVFARALLHYLRLWDISTAARVNAFVAISHYVADRIWNTYRRRAHVIYPPVDVHLFDPNRPRENHYLAVSRFVPYKRMDLIVETFSRLKLPLTVIGDGPELPRVKKDAAENITFLGWQTDESIREHMSRCKALVFAADEDFGIVPVEAQAAGAPVIAYGKGGSLETVLHGRTGIHFPEQTVESLTEAVRAMESGAYQFDTPTIRQHAEKFSAERFRREFADFLEKTKARFMKRAARTVEE